MELITLQNNRLEVSPYALSITEFKVLWEKDTSPTKDNAIKELSFVYFMADYKSIYRGYVGDTKREKIIHDLDMGDYKMTPEVIAAILKYESIQTTPTIRLLKTTEETLGKIEAFYDKYLPALDLTGAKFRSIVGSMKQLGDVIKSLETLQKKAELETAAKSIRANHTLGLRENPRGLSKRRADAISNIKESVSEDSELSEEE